MELRTLILCSVKLKTKKNDTVTSKFNPTFSLTDNLLKNNDNDY